MKTITFKSVMAVLVALFSLNALAYDVEIDGIYYNLVSKTKTAEVTFERDDYSLLSTSSTYEGKVVIPKSVFKDGITYNVTSIGPKAFHYCRNLTSVEIPSGVTCIGDEAFAVCQSLYSVNIPDGVTSIGNDAFRNCTRLVSINIPNSVTSIGKYAFDFCKSLKSVTIPNTITKLEGGTFKNCESLTSVTIPESVKELDSYVFSGCTSLTSIELSNSVTSLGQGLFESCGGLTSVTIPYSVTSIGYRAFSGCSGLTSITIPYSVKAITDLAFSGCSELADVYCSAVQIPTRYSGSSSIAQDIFKDSYIEYATLHVPTESLELYQSTAPWSGFGKIVAIKPFHTLTYLVDGETYKTIETEEGTDITALDEPTKEGYTFSGWQGLPSTMPTNDVTVTGSFTINKYNLIYNVDGEEYKSVQINYGATITPEVEPVKEGYSFSGWSEIPKTMPAKDVTITGSFSKGQYKLTYIVDGETYKTVSMDFGAPIIVEKDPAKEGYTFSGWSEIPASMPAKDVKVTGAFTINKYKFTYIVDGEQYKSLQMNYGTTITPEAEPAREGYTFSGWSLIPATMPAKDVTVTGAFTKGQYKLTYLVDGQTYKTVSMDFGTPVIVEKDPAKEGCTFSGWSEIPETMPAKDVTVTGSFTPNKYNLIYNVDGETYKSYEVEYGKSITAEAEPTKDKYSFSGWSEIPATMPAHDVTVTGSFIRIPLVASYKRNLSSQTTGVSSMIVGSYVRKSVGFNLVNLGKESITVTELVVKNASNYAVVSRSTDTSLLGTLAAGNSIELSVNLTSDITTCYEWHYIYKGQEFVFCSDINDPAMKHDVTFYVDGQIYVTYEYDLGDEVIPEEEPTKEHYTFSGWSEIPTTMPDKNVAVNGTFIGDKYTLTYIVDEETYKTYEVKYGTSITAEAAPTKEGYTFSGWDEIPATMPANDVTVTGSFAINNYKLTYIVDGEEYKSVQVNYGEEITLEAEPTKEGYTFSGWNDIPATMPAKDVIVTGSFNVNSYKLVYMVDGEGYKTFNVSYGASITAEAAPTKEGYSFSGWGEMPATMPANDVTVTGSFTINKYTLAYVVDGENYVTYEVNYGTQIFPLPELTKEGYTFSGWSTIPETMPAHDVTITGTFTFIDAIEDVTADEGEYQIYTLDGMPIETLQKGVNIIKYISGKVKKVVVK